MDTHNTIKKQTGRKNIYDPIYKRDLKESEECLQSLPLHQRHHMANFHSQVFSKVSQIEGSTKRTRKKFSLFGKKPKTVTLTFAKETQQSSKLQQDLVQKMMEDSSTSRLSPGLYPPYMEAQILKKMKQIANSKAEQRLWEESYFILKGVLRCERTSLGNNHPQVANTLYHIGLALNWLGDSENAISALEEGIQILFPRRYSERNVDLAAMYYQYGIVEGKRGDYTSALYHLDLAKQVEIHIFGNATEKIRKIIEDYKHALSASRGLNQIRHVARSA